VFSGPVQASKVEAGRFATRHTTASDRQHRNLDELQQHELFPYLALVFLRTGPGAATPNTSPIKHRLPRPRTKGKASMRLTVKCHDKTEDGSLPIPPTAAIPSAAAIPIPVVSCCSEHRAQRENSGQPRIRKQLRASTRASVAVKSAPVSAAAIPVLVTIAAAVPTVPAGFLLRHSSPKPTTAERREHEKISVGRIAIAQVLAVKSDPRFRKLH
jgi:hypothetical protein